MTPRLWVMGLLDVYVPPKAPVRSVSLPAFVLFSWEIKSVVFLFKKYVNLH